LGNQSTVSWEIRALCVTTSESIKEEKLKHLRSCKLPGKFSALESTRTLDCVSSHKW